MSGFISELKRRNVIRMAGLYLVGAWLLTQVASILPPMCKKLRMTNLGQRLGRSILVIPAEAGGALQQPKGWSSSS